MANKLFDIISKFLNKYLNIWAIYAMDLLVSLISSLISLSIFFYVSQESLETSKSIVFAWMTFSLIGSVVMFAAVRSHHLVIRHSSMKDLLKFCIAMFGKVALMAVAIKIMNVWVPSVWLYLSIDFVLSVFILSMVRSVMIMVYDTFTSRTKNRSRLQRVLVYNTSDKAVALLTRLQNSDHYKIVGFVTRESGEKNLSILDLPVYYCSEKKPLKDIIETARVDAILFATDGDAREERKDIIREATSEGVKVLISPSIDEVVGGHLEKGKIREINIEDLLGRPEIKISMDKIVDNFNNKVVMVTGAAGSIGSELCRQLASFGPKQLVLFDNAETPMHNLRLELEERFPELDFVPVIGDVRLQARLDYAFRKWRPQVVFHAAAYKHVPLMEENPCEAVLVNACGSRNVADKCLEYNVEKMIMISTDKAVNPTNVMGCTKRLAEIYVQSLGLAIAQGQREGKTKFITTRFGNVLGSNGSVIPRFREQIAKGGPVTVTHPEINRFFMTIPEACRLVMEAATISTGNQIVVFDMGKPVKIADLARHMIELAGFVPNKDIMIEFTGLRPGEKLYEEVLATAENTEETSHDRIRVAKVREYPHQEAAEDILRLEELARNVEIPTLIKTLQEIVPEYDCKWGK